MSDAAVRTAVGLLERETELCRVADILGDAAGGQGRLLGIEGPAGMGKTALLESTCRLAEESGFVVLRASAGELERDFPHGIVRQLFEAHVRARSAAERTSLMSGAAQLAAPVLASEPAPALPDAATDTTFAVSHGLFWLTANLADEAPLMLAVDDAQWSDVSSLRFLVHLARRLEGMAVLVAVTIRAGEAGGGDVLLAELTSQRGAQMLRPEPLSEPGVATIIAERLGEEPDAEFAAACHRATGGTPFLVGELVSALRLQRIRPGRASVAEVDEIGPRALARTMMLRLERLPAAAAALARAVAILGSDGRLHRAARLAGIEVSAAVEAADGLAAMNVLRPGRPLEFVHPIVRGAVYASVPAAARAAAHARAASLLVEEGAELDAIATHLLLTEPAADPEMVDRLREAASRAVTRGAPESAAAYLRRALDEGGVDSERLAAVLCELGRAESFTRPSAGVDRLRHAHRLARDPVQRARIAYELAQTLFYIGEWDAALAIVGSAIAEDQRGDPELTVRLETLRAGQEFHDARLLPAFLGRLPRLRAIVDGGGSAVRGAALLLAGSGAWIGKPVQEVRRTLEIGLDGDRFLAEEGSESWLVPQVFMALVLTEDLDGALRMADSALADARRRGSVTGFRMTLCHRAWAYSRGGDLVSAEADLRSALTAIREHHVRFGEIAALWFCIDALIERPRLDDLARDAQALEIDAGVERVELRTMGLELRGRVRLAAGDFAVAVEDLRQCADTPHAQGPTGWSWRPALALAIAPQDRDAALELARADLDIARRIDLPRGVGIALRTLGLVEGGEEGLLHLEESVRVLEGSPARLEYARALVEFGAATRRANRRAAAREPLRLGLDLAHRCGATRLAERARAELAATGARPRSERITGRDALTATEQRIAGMAAEGMSNPEIAQSLFVTRKTVENHLAHVYAKLGIDSRTRLADALANAG